MPYRSVRSRLSQADTWLVEVLLGLYTLLWGLGYANPLTDTFAVNPTSYRMLSQFPGGELPFGLTVAALGACMLSMAWRGGRQARGRAAGAVGIFWVAITIAVGAPTHWAAGGLPHFGLVALAHWYCWVRLSYREPA